MSARTITVYGTASFDGRDKEMAKASIQTLLDKLEETASEEGREVLWDTLDIKIEDVAFDASTQAESVIIVSNMIYGNVKAIANENRSLN